MRDEEAEHQVPEHYLKCICSRFYTLTCSRVDVMKVLRSFGLLFLAFSLFLVWPIGHTIALRNVLLAVTLLLVLLSAGSLQLQVRRAPSPIVWLAVFLFWALFQAFFCAIDFLGAINAVWGQFAPALAAGLLGWALGVQNHESERMVWLWRGVVLILTAHTLATVWSGVAPLFQGGAVLRRVGGLTEGPDKSSYLTITLACILLAAVFAGKAGGLRRVVPLPGALVLGLLVIMTLYVEQIRNGIVSLSVSVSMLLFFLLTQPTAGRRQKTIAVAIMVGALASLVVLALTDPRWQATGDSARLAWQADTRSTVLDATPPLGGGDPSAFLRLAMLKEGLKLVAQYPLGVGFHRNAFGHGLRLVYGEGSGHSHSSLLDIAIGTGIPGLFFIVAFFVALMRAGWQAERRDEDGFGLLLLLLTTATLARAAIDSCLRDHMLQQSFFLFGILLAMTQAKRDTIPGRLAP